MTEYYENGQRVHAPKPIFKTSEAPLKESVTTKYDCVNLHAMKEWTVRKGEEPLGDCVYYDSALFDQAMADWEEAEAEFQERLLKGEIQ